MVSVGNRLFFNATIKDFGEQLWISDGTPRGTHAVLDFPQWGKLNRLTSLSGELIYYNKSKYQGDEVIWRSNGTENGTYIIPPMINASDLRIYPFGKDNLYIRHSNIYNRDQVKWQHYFYSSSSKQIIPTSFDWIGENTGSFSLTPSESGSTQDFMLLKSASGVYATQGTEQTTYSLPGVQMGRVLGANPFLNQVYFFDENASKEGTSLGISSFNGEVWTKMNVPIEFETVQKGSFVAHEDFMLIIADPENNGKEELSLIAIPTEGDHSPVVLAKHLGLLPDGKTLRVGHLLDQSITMGNLAFF